MNTWKLIRRCSFCLASGIGWAVVWCAAAEPPREPPPRLRPLPAEIVAPEDNLPTDAKIGLGRQLFFDPRLSGDNRMSCATCHLPAKAFGDGLRTATGHAGKPLARNTPTVLNVALLQPLFWDGRASTLEQQALAPIESPVEMHQDLAALEDELQAIKGYAEQFRQVFGAPVSRDGIAKALAAYQRALITPDAPLDRYLRGDKQALTPAARRGLELFTGDAGCIRCHHGPLLTDGKFYRLGISSPDQGRGAITGQREDDFKFRTPSLRNVADTAPYMHNGALQTLDDVVLFYFRGVPRATADGQPVDLEPLVGQSFSDMPDLVAFLRALSGPVVPVEPPALP